MLRQFSATDIAFQGAAAAAIGLSLSMGIRAARRQIRKPIPAVVLALVFAGVGLLKLPMITVVAIMAPASVAIAYRRGAGSKS